MGRVGLIQDFNESLQLVPRLIAAATNPRDRAFIALLGRSGIRISEAIQIQVSHIDFDRGTLTIVHHRERLRLKCPNCGENLPKRYPFCPGCGEKASQAVREKTQEQSQRVIPIDYVTLGLIQDYLEWRCQFPYRGRLLFPFSRQRGWQLVSKLGRRIGITGFHPHSLRHLLATIWLGKGLDVMRLEALLGRSSTASTVEYVDSGFQQLRADHEKLWQIAGDEETGSQEDKR